MGDFCPLGYTKCAQPDSSDNRSSTETDDNGEIFVGRGTSWESASRLSRQALEAEANPTRRFPHGVSVTTPESNAALSNNPVDASYATRKALETAGFRVERTPTKTDPNHHTVVLPKPVTPEVAARFNLVFGRSKR